MEVGNGSGRRRDRDGDREEREGEERGVTRSAGTFISNLGKRAAH